jgi:LuxR family transcriptional regulator, maltose regulon positive regulatory protein
MADEKAQTVALDQVLLDAKLSIPRPRVGIVSRGTLIERARASGCGVVAVTAPAGYGKSTLMAEWARSEGRPVVWISLDHLDDDPATFLTLLASAFARVSPGNADLVADIGGPGIAVLGRAAPRLAAAFRTSRTPFVLMLDDLHELRSPACHDVLSVVVSGLPPTSQLVAASRHEQPHIPRLRASGAALEVTASDLALDSRGAEMVFAAVNVHITPELAAEVTERTEGWPVGLYLAALIAQDSEGDALAVAGDDRYIADYLHRESLAKLPPDTQRFLRQTSVLDQFCAPLCQALVGSSDTYDQLRALEASNAFLIPLDRRRGWYRYHALFREFLLAELRRVEHEIIPKLHLCAADWYESNGSPVKAVDHLLSTTERDRCIQLVTSLILPTYQAGQLSTVQRWLSALGDSAVVEYPPLAVMAGWVATVSGQADDALRLGAILDAASFDQIGPDGAASFESARALLRSWMCPSGPERALEDANLALAQEPAQSVWRDSALCSQAYAYLLLGEEATAMALLSETSTLAASLGNVDNVTTCEAELARVRMDHGEWAAAAEHVEVALALIDQYGMHDYEASLLTFACAARLAVHRGDLANAHQQLNLAMRARPSSTVAVPFVAVRLRLELAKVYWGIGDRNTARQLDSEIDDILRVRPALGVLVEEVTEFRQMMASAPRSKFEGGAPLTPAELRLLPYLQTHLTLGEIAERVFVSRNTVGSQVNSIYRKFGVSSRNEAVRSATTAGLVG